MSLRGLFAASDNADTLRCPVFGKVWRTSSLAIRHKPQARTDIMPRQMTQMLQRWSRLPTANCTSCATKSYAATENACERAEFTASFYNANSAADTTELQ